MIIIKPALLALATSAFAQQQVPMSSNSLCLSSAAPNECCDDSVQNSQTVINGRTFKFTCSSILKAVNTNTAQKVGNAHECASLCANDMTCEASSFKTSGTGPGGKNCYFVRGDNLEEKSSGDWMTFKEIFLSCLESDDRNACCSDPVKQSGEILIENKPWKWTCGKILSSLNSKSKPAANAAECASLCASQNCDAISFRVQGNNPRGNCFFILGDNKNQGNRAEFLSLTKVVDDPVEPPIEDDKCDTCDQERQQCILDKNECNNKYETCTTSLDEAHNTIATCRANEASAALESEELTTCKAENESLQFDKDYCGQRLKESEKLKKTCSKEQQKCEEDIGNIRIEKLECENEKNAKDREIATKDAEILALMSQIATITAQKDVFEQSYNNLYAQCNGGGPNGNCRTNLVDAEPRDDQCIIATGNKQFKIHYAKLDDPGAADLGTGKAGSFKECAEKCANYSGAKKCVRFMWKTDGQDRACYMRSTGYGMVPTQSSLWSSGQLL